MPDRAPFFPPVPDTAFDGQAKTGTRIRLSRPAGDESTRPDLSAQLAAIAAGKTSEPVRGPASTSDAWEDSTRPDVSTELAAAAGTAPPGADTIEVRRDGEATKVNEASVVARALQTARDEPTRPDLAGVIAAAATEHRIERFEESPTEAHQRPMIDPPTLPRIDVDLEALGLRPAKAPTVVSVEEIGAVLEEEPSIAVVLPQQPVLSMPRPGINVLPTRPAGSAPTKPAAAQRSRAVPRSPVAKESVSVPETKTETGSGAPAPSAEPITDSRPVLGPEPAAQLRSALAAQQVQSVQPPAVIVGSENYTDDQAAATNQFVRPQGEVPTRFVPTHVVGPAKVPTPFPDAAPSPRRPSEPFAIVAALIVGALGAYTWPQRSDRVHATDAPAVASAVPHATHAAPGPVAVGALADPVQPVAQPVPDAVPVTPGARAEQRDVTGAGVPEPVPALPPPVSEAAPMEVEVEVAPQQVLPQQPGPSADATGSNPGPAPVPPRGSEDQAPAEVDSADAQGESDKKTTRRKQRDIPRWREAIAEARKHWKAQDYRAAAKHYRRASRFHPRHAGTWSGLGASYLRAKNYEAALQAYRRAIRVAPRRANFRAALGAAYEGLGRNSDAAKSYMRALKIAPTHKRARRGLDRLRGASR